MRIAESTRQHGASMVSFRSCRVSHACTSMPITKHRKKDCEKKEGGQELRKKSLHSLNTKTNSQQFGCSRDTAGEPQEQQIGWFSFVIISKKRISHQSPFWKSNNDVFSHEKKKETWKLDWERLTWNEVLCSRGVTLRGSQNGHWWKKKPTWMPLKSFKSLVQSCVKWYPSLKNLTWDVVSVEKCFCLEIQSFSQRLALNSLFSFFFFHKPDINLLGYRVFQNLVEDFAQLVETVGQIFSRSQKGGAAFQN